MIHVGDITKLHGWELPPVDCITGGSPCQDLSLAGKRTGLAGERSGLFMEQIRLIKEMRDATRTSALHGSGIKPRYMVWENVAGAFSSNGGKDFKTVLEESIRIADPKAPDLPMPGGGGWSKCGCIYSEVGAWSIAWRLHDAKYWGVPQRRKRISLVADFGGLSAPEVLLERKGVRWDTAESEEQGKGAAGDSSDSTGTAIGADIYNGQITGEVACTITTGTSDSTQTGAKVISFQERAGKPGGGKGILIQDEHTGALSTQNKQSVCYGISSYDSNAMKSDNPHSGIYEADTSRTLDLNGGNPACNQGGMAVEPVLGECERVLAKIGSWGIDQNVGALCARDFKGVGNQYVNEGKVIATHTVRRLTPLECERLQGFPDGWTDIGEWKDSKGKVHESSDSARYKALGNSIALPFWFYLLRRISAQYERPATLGSLFDGIGGFPLCWERCNGKGTAIWASEIEEFPIAVTKARFGA